MSRLLHPGLLLGGLLAILHNSGCLLACLATDLLASPWVWLRRRRCAPTPPLALDPVTPRECSIVILNYDGRTHLERLLPSLRQALDQTPGDHEVLVVDNGSQDGSADWLESSFDWLRCIRLPENRYFIRGNAAGTALASKDILVFLNNDMEVAPDFLVALLAPFGDPDLFAVTAAIEMQGTQVETGLTRADFRRGALHLTQVTPGPDAPIPACWAGGGSSAFDRAKLQQIGGFETLYEPCYAEDLSLSYQAWRRGYRVLFNPQARVQHSHRGTSEKVFGRRGVEILDRRNRELFFWRSITDPRLMTSKALWSWWNLYKDARRHGYGVQILALLRSLPRLPQAIWARQRSRPWLRRGDRDCLRLANWVSAHRRSLGPGSGPPALLSLGSHPGAEPLALPGLRSREVLLEIPRGNGRPHDDLLRRVPTRFFDAARPGPLRDRVRDLLREHDFDLLLFRDPETLVAAAAEIPAGETCWLQREAPLPKAEQTYLRRITRHLRLHETSDPRELSPVPPSEPH